jgi:hypothetical protein
MVWITRSPCSNRGIRTLAFRPMGLRTCGWITYTLPFPGAQPPSWGVYRSSVGLAHPSFYKRRLAPPWPICCGRSPSIFRVSLWTPSHSGLGCTGSLVHFWPVRWLPFRAQRLVRLTRPTWDRTGRVCGRALWLWLVHPSSLRRVRRDRRPPDRGGGARAEPTPKNQFWLPACQDSFVTCRACGGAVVGADPSGHSGARLRYSTNSRGPGALAVPLGAMG